MPPLAIVELIVVVPLPLIVRVLLLLLLDKFTPPESFNVPVMLFVTVRDPVSVQAPLNSMLLAPVNVRELVPPSLTVLAIAFAPVKSMPAEILTGLVAFKATALVPKAALLPRMKVPLFKVVVPE